MSPCCCWELRAVSFHLQMQNNFTTLCSFTAKPTIFCCFSPPHNSSINCDFTPSACICITFSLVLGGAQSLFKYFCWLSSAFISSRVLPIFYDRRNCLKVIFVTFAAIATHFSTCWWGNNEESYTLPSDSNWCNFSTREAFIASPLSSCFYYLEKLVNC